MKKAIVFLCILSLCLSCIIAAQRIRYAALNKAALYGPDYTEYIKVDTFYSLFFGEWEVTEFIPSGRGEYNAGMIGKKISFQRHLLNADGISVHSPQYLSVIIPMSKWHTYCGYIVPDDPEQVFCLESPYFAHITISELVTDHNELLWASSFYIKDENTIIFDSIVEGRRGLYRAVRTDSIDDWSTYIAES